MNNKLVRLCAVAVACVLLQPHFASAQEHGPIGITMGYPSSVGVMWHITDRVALRPEIALSTATTDPSSKSVFGTSGSSGSTVEVGISGLFYVAQWDRLRTYVAPRYQHSRFSATAETTSQSFSFTSGPAGLTTTRTETTRTTDTTITNTSAAGMFGAEYSLHERF